MRFVALLVLASAPGIAETWTGNLVDSRCYESRLRNVNPTDTLTYVDRDRGQDIRYCAPSSKTKSYAVVQQDGLIFNFDSGGNAKASEVVQKAGKRSSRFFVTVTGDISKKTITVDSISAPR
jgi:hypothetical protein